MEVSFSKSFLKHILNKPLVIKDLEDFDSDTYRSLEGLMNTTIKPEDMLSLYYEHALTFFDSQHYNISLIENGSNIEVTEQNKK